MNIQELLKVADDANITLSVTLADLREFALAIVDEIMEAEVLCQVKGNVGKEKDELFTQTQAAKYLGKSKGTLWRWHKNKYLVPTSYIGSTPMYSKMLLDGIKFGKNKT